MDLLKTVKILEDKGYTVSVFDNGNDAASYLDGKIDQKTVGFGGSITLKELGLIEKLSAHNTVYSHWKTDKSVKETLKSAMDTEVYICSANAIAETGEIVNIDATGNRVAGTLYGHDKVYIVVGINKFAPTLCDAISRARNIASPQNAQRLNCNTPCAKSGDKCYDCKSADRICNAMVIHFAKMRSCDMEIVIIKEKLGY